MWQNIADSGFLIIGVMALFAVFLAALFILERKGEKRHRRKEQPLRVAGNTKRAAWKSS